MLQLREQPPPNNCSDLSFFTSPQSNFNVLKIDTFTCYRVATSSYFYSSSKTDYFRPLPFIIASVNPTLPAGSRRPSDPSWSSRRRWRISWASTTTAERWSAGKLDGYAAVCRCRFAPRWCSQSDREWDEWCLETDENMIGGTQLQHTYNYRVISSYWNKPEDFRLALVGAASREFKRTLYIDNRITKHDVTSIRFEYSRWTDGLGH